MLMPVPIDIFYWLVCDCGCFYFILCSPMHHKFLDLSSNIFSEWKVLYQLGSINLQLWWWRKSSLTFIACKLTITMHLLCVPSWAEMLYFESALPQIKFYLHFSLLHLLRPSLFGRSRTRCFENKKANRYTSWNYYILE